MQSYADDYPASYPERAGAAANDSLGYSWVGDSTYRIERTVHTTSPTLTVTFTASQLQELSDESWGIDNVVVRR